MMQRHFVCALLVAAAAPSLALAQSADLFDRGRNVSVRERPRPDYDALGIRAGTFLLYPKVEASVAYEDNIFALPTNEQSDTVTSIVPSVAAVSQWSRHQLQGFARANVYRYADFPAQGSETYSVGGSGRLDVLRTTALRASVSYDELVEPRSSASSPQNAAEPVHYRQSSLDFGATHVINRLRLQGDVRYRDYRFDDTRSFLNTVIDEDYRDNTSWEAQGRVDYALSPALAVYGSLIGTTWEFASPSVPGDVSRDADGMQASAGVDFEITRLVRGQAQLGYVSQSFEDPRVGDVEGLGLLAKVEYFPTELITLTANAERNVVATGVIGAGGVIRTAGGGQVDYELRRNLVLTAKTQRLHEDYQGVSREDDVWTAMIGAYYLLNRRVGLNVIYNFYDQQSSGASAGPDFAVNRIQLGLVVQY